MRDLKIRRRRPVSFFVPIAGVVLWLVTPPAFASAQTPTISAVSPATGDVGTSVTIAGSNFGASQGASTVTFNGVPAVPSSWGSTQIVAPVPGTATAFAATGAAMQRDAAYFDPTNSFTIAFWLNLTGLVGSDYRTALMLGDSNWTNPYFWLGTGPNNTLWIEAFDGTDWIDFMTPAPLTAGWHYVVMTYDASTDVLKAYVDDVQIGSDTLVMTAFVEEDEYIGWDTWSVGSGLALAHFRNWQGALTPTEFAAEKVSTAAVRTTNLLSARRLYGPSDTGDQSGNGHTWTTLGSLGTMRGAISPGSAVQVSAGNRLTRSSSFFDGADDFTIAFWFKLLAESNQWRDVYTFGDRENWTNSYIWLGTGSSSGPNRIFTFGIWNGTDWYEVVTPNELSADWHHAALTFDAATETFTAYIDGQSLGTTEGEMVPFVEKAEYLDEGSAFAYLRTWQRVLSASQIQAEKVATSAIVTSDLLTDSALSSVSNVQDQSGNGRHWEVKGVPFSIRGPLVPDYGPVVVTVGGIPSSDAIFGLLPPTLTYSAPTGTTVGESEVLVSGTITSSLSAVSGITCNSNAAVITGNSFSCVVSLSEGANSITVAVLEHSGVTSNLSKSVTYASQVTYKYDALGRLVQVTDKSGNSALYFYDAVGNITKIERINAGDVSVSSVPLSASIGSTIVLSGTGFSPLASNNTVTVNGTALTAGDSASGPGAG